jgi:hypothetical protein
VHDDEVLAEFRQHPNGRRPAAHVGPAAALAGDGARQDQFGRAVELLEDRPGLHGALGDGAAVFEAHDGLRRGRLGPKADRSRRPTVPRAGGRGR